MGSTLSPFGLKQFPAQEKTAGVQQVFSSVAPSYDVMNDLMSGGLHRWWKWYLLQLVCYPNTHSIIDLACGSGDVLLGHARRMHRHTRLTGIDPNQQMLDQASHRLDRQGVFSTQLVLAPAEQLPCENTSQDLITLSFGLRNTTDMHKALSECWRVLKPGGRLLVLEFSHPTSQLVQRGYAHFSRLLPGLGKLVAKDHHSYQYLVDSIKTHPDQPTLATRCRDAGFALVNWINLSNGIVAIHNCYKG